jgi:hypothetical protein
MIEAVYDSGECMLEVLFLDGATIARLTPLYDEEDEEEDYD